MWERRGRGRERGREWGQAHRPHVEVKLVLFYHYTGFKDQIHVVRLSRQAPLAIWVMSPAWFLSHWLHQRNECQDLCDCMFCLSHSFSDLAKENLLSAFKNRGLENLSDNLCRTVSKKMQCYCCISHGGFESNHISSGWDSEGTCHHMPKGSRRLRQSFSIWSLAKRIPSFLEAPLLGSHDPKVIVLTWSHLLVS